MATITPEALKPLLTGDGEIAFIDVREAGLSGEGRPFFAINIPYSRLEPRASTMLPRKDVSIVLMDDGDGLAAKAAKRLDALGYSEVKVMKGGAPAWEKAGYTLFKGVNLPSKTFGELVEHAAHTPHVTAQALHDMQERGEKFVLLDGRTPGEYRRMTIPGSRSLPNAELGHRIPALVHDTTTPIVVNCAGRTRSIIGAQSLINMGVENPVYALENGTQGWMLAGYELARNNTPQPLPDLDTGDLTDSGERAQTVIDKFYVPSAHLEDIREWELDKTRTLYLLDVRSKEEYEAGHMPGSVHAPGGQLVQATDQWVAVRGARIVLCDDTGLRAANTAVWLRRMGHNAYVLREDVTSLDESAEGAESEDSGAPALGECVPEDLAQRLEAGAVLIDLRPSMDFRKGHVEGAQWSIRPRLGKMKLKRDADVILAADTAGIAELAAIDLREQGITKIARLGGGVAEWREAGLEIAETPDDPPDRDCIDYLFFVHDRHEGNLDAARGYLEWELGLVDQVDEQERGVFILDF